MAMGAVLSDIPPTRFKLAVEQYHRMDELGIPRPDDRVELIDGERVRKAPVGSRPAAPACRLARPRPQGISGSPPSFFCGLIRSSRLTPSHIAMAAATNTDE